jgi:hypothetical protein
MCSKLTRAQPAIRCDDVQVLLRDIQKAAKSYTFLWEVYLDTTTRWAESIPALSEVYRDIETRWRNSVPAEWRGKVRGGNTQLNELNSEDYWIHFVEILAIDKNGQALVCLTDCHNYTGVDDANAYVMGIDKAYAMCKAYREAYAGQLIGMLIDFNFENAYWF